MDKLNLDVKNPVQVYRAEVQSLGYHPSDTYCKKFVNELDYIKHIAENQPVTTVTYTRRFWSEAERVWVDLSGIETAVLKTYDLQKTDWFKAEWNGKNDTYVIKKIETINENNLEYNN